MRNATLFAASVLTAILASQARAQSQFPDHRWMFSPNSIQQSPAPSAQPSAAPPVSAQPSPAPSAAKQPPQRPKAATRADTAKRTARPQAARPAATPPGDALPRVTAKDDTPAPKPTIGRVPFETGTLGFTTDTQYKSMEFNDGRRTPGFENIQRKDSSYLGFSLSVPTDKQTIIPLPFLSRP